MPVLNIEGRRVRVDDSFLQLSPDEQNRTVDEIASQIGAAPIAEKTGRLPADNVEAEKSKRDEYYSSGIYSGEYNPLGPIAKTIDAFASGAQRSPLFGWDDEAVAAARSVAGNTDYATAQREEDAKKRAMREQNPIASTAGELSGGLATGGKLAQGGLTLAGRNIPFLGRTGAAALEGAGYGAVVGAGEAKPGERLYGAGMGAAVGAATGAAASKAGDMLASRSARNASQAAAPSADDLAGQAQPLYQQAYQSGVSIKPQNVDRVIQNMKIAAGRPNEKLRPQTMGIVEDLDAMIGKPMDIQTFHELRQTIDKTLKTAQGSDEVALNRMRTILNGFADSVDQSKLTGPKQAVDIFRQADDLWRRSSKTAKIEELFDLADVKSARYSQSGMSNAVRDKASQLYTRIVKGQEKGFSKEEVDLVRRLAKGEMTPKLVQLIAKFAPRGVVSLGAGVGIGGALGGPIGAAIPGAVGFVAANMADRAAVGGVQALRNAAATGNAPVLNAITNKTVPFIGGTAGALSSQITRTR